MDVSASTAAWIAIAACVVAGLALLVVLWLLTRLHRMREAQMTLLGGGKADLVEEVAGALARVDRRVDGAVTNTSVIRYDAY